MGRPLSSLLGACLAVLLGPGCGDGSTETAESTPGAGVPAKSSSVVGRELVAAYAEHGATLPPLSEHLSGPDGTVYRFDVDAERAIATWEELRPLADAVGHYPVVCRDESGLLAELVEFNDTPPVDVIRLAATLRVPEWFDERSAGDPEYYGSVELGEWEDVEPQAGFTVPFDVLTGRPADDVWIALVPTPHPWEALAYLHYGGWNECPGPAAHVAVQKDWYERFGAELVCATGDIVELRVARPLMTREDAQVLAREQFLYSGGDLVFQGYDTLRRLTESLVGAETWFFWWD